MNLMTDYDKFLSRAGGWMQESPIRQMGSVLAQAQDMVSFAPGYPDEKAFPWQAFAEISRDLLSGAEGAALQYGPTRGFRGLRDVIVALMAERRVRVSDERIVVTTGSQQGLDLVARVLLDPGDVVLLELPSYTGAIAAFRNVGASLVGVRQADDGIDFADLDRVMGQLRRDGRTIKLLYLVPNFHNPTGRLLPSDRRQRAVDWAEREDVLILEDDPYRDLFFPEATGERDTLPIAGIDQGRRVIYLSSFSKTLAPGLRVGWLCAPAPIAAKVELAKQAEDLCTGGLDQRLVYEACRRGVLAGHLPALRTLYQQKRNAMSAALCRRLAGRMSWPEPRGGFFLWGRLEPPLTSETLLPFARARGVLYVGGRGFFVDGTGDAYLRLSFSAPPIDRIELGVNRLADAIGDAAADAP